MASMDQFARVGVGYVVTCIVGGCAVIAAGLALPEGWRWLTPLLVVLGLIAVIIGVTGIGLDLRAWWQHRERKPRALQATTTQPPRASRWLTDPDNLLSLRLTNEDLDASLERALAYAKDLLGQDAKAFFISVTLLPHIEILVAGQSRYAGRKVLMHVRDDFITHEPPMDGSWFVADAMSEEPDYDFDPGEPPWRIDGTWRELIERVWIRIRPFEGSFELERSVDQWRIAAHPRQGESRIFFLRDDVVLEWKAPPEWDAPTHALASAGATLVCRCGEEFSTGPEFADHLRGPQ
jgi:hypothetical protein